MVCSFAGNPLGASASVSNKSGEQLALWAVSGTLGNSPPQWALGGAFDSKPDIITIALILISKEILHLRQYCCQNQGMNACSAVCLLLSQTIYSLCQTAALQGYSIFDLCKPAFTVQGTVIPRIPKHAWLHEHSH